MRTSLRYGLAVLFLIIVLVGLGVSFYVRSLGPRTRDRVIRALQDRFDADINVKSYHLAFFPHPTLVVEGLSIQHKNWSIDAPLMYMRRLTATSGYLTLIGGANKVDAVRLEGLTIHVPATANGLRQPPGDQANVASAEPGHDTTRLKFLIATIVADDSQLEIEPKVQGKHPIRLQIKKLTLRSVQGGQPMAFKTTIKNAKPPGLIDSTGEFGPWQRDAPRTTPISGNYTFQNADLSIFKGIAGTLSSDGSFHGVLQHIEVDGTTDTPKFALKRRGEPVHLIANFHSIVNGTDGDTILDGVEAHFLHSAFMCKGSIVHNPGANGKTVSLDAVTNHGRIEDILLLLISNKPPLLTGAVNFQSKIVIPPGHEEVIDKLKVAGQFDIVSAEFTNSKLQENLKTLSDRAQGITKNQEGSSRSQMVGSNFKGKFRLSDGVASLSQLSFNIPGAQITLTGTYGLRSEAINMEGALRMHATLSETQSGIKHWLLKPLDPFFEKDGAGLLLPLRITGSRDHPVFGTQIFHRQITIH